MVQVDLGEPYQARQAPAVGQCGHWEEGVREAIHVEGGQPHCILGGELRPGLKVLEQIEIARDCEKKINAQGWADSPDWEQEQQQKQEGSHRHKRKRGEKCCCVHSWAANGRS